MSSKSKLVLYPSGRKGHVLQRTMLTKPQDDAVGWPVPFRPDFDPSMLTSAYQCSFTAESIERGSQARTQDHVIAKPVLYH